VINLRINFPHGLGDCVQFSVVLKHLRKYRPDWRITVRCGRGKHTALVGLCHQVVHDQEPEPRGPFERVVDVGFFENYNGYTDKPCSKITNTLMELFGLNYDENLGRYEIIVRPQTLHRAELYLSAIGVERSGARYKAVILHYEGNTSPGKKNLAHWQAKEICELVQKTGRVPIILDWDRRSPLPDQKTIFCPGQGSSDIWGGFGSGDAEMITALISLAEAYIGIDSGPGKAASATETPSLICWKSHHPIQFHDPAPNTVHLIPENWRTMTPVCDARGIAEYFEKHYLFATYEGEYGMVSRAQHWLLKALGCQDKLADVMGVTFVLPNGIGDVMWVLLKIRAIAADRPIDIIVSGRPGSDVDYRAVPFLKRFPFIRNVQVMDIPILSSPVCPTNTRGRYSYLADGIRGPHHFLVANAVLEDGRRIEEWQPQYPVDWKVIDEFDWRNTERGTKVGRSLFPFIAFYLGPERGNVDEGHNRGFLWEPKHWIVLGADLCRRGFKIAVVGADYDRSFWERYVRTGVQESGQHWIDLIGKFEIGECFAFLKEAKAFVSYQCGLGIVAHYLGVNVAMWWRPEGNSCHGERLVTFSERMATAWIRPEYQQRFMPLIYQRENPEDIVTEMERRKWLE
jgi:ADP-heptose:LPS heptosyltransferase